MEWDYSIRQRAEDRWQEMCDSVAEQHLLHLAGKDPRWGSASVNRSRGRPKQAFVSGSLAGWIRQRLASISGMSLIMVALITVNAEATPLANIARNLAENVLGEGLVTSVRTADNDATVLIRWQSATYKPANTQAAVRELLYAEAVLATRSIMWGLGQVSRVRFTITQGEHLLATGQATRAQGVSLMFAPALGGGTYYVPESTPKPLQPGGYGSPRPE